MMVAIFSFTLNELHDAKLHYFAKKSQAMLNLVGELSRFALFSAEYDDLQPYIERVAEDPIVNDAIVVDRHNRVVAASNTTLVGNLWTGYKENSSSIWQMSELSNVSGPLGHVAINFSYDELSEVHRHAVIKGVGIAITGMLIIAVVGIVTGFLLTRRLARLTHTAQRIADGDLEANTGISGSDEIAVLGRSFDQMTQKIKTNIVALEKRELELEQTRDQLELRVHERTAELATANKELERLALYDELTGLPNRTLLSQRLRYGIFQAKDQSQPLAMLMLDLDYFKEVNDSLGHRIGDELLIQVGHRIHGVLRDKDTVARVGGDEFSLILPNTHGNHTIQIVQRILKSLEPPFVIAGNRLSIAASVGVANFPEHGDDANQLMQRADIAMYLAKRGKKGYAVFSHGQSVIHPSRLSLVSDLRQAIDQNELVLAYQPKVGLQPGSTSAVEALVRWRKGDHVIPPDKFVPFAEQTGLIYPLTEWVLINALQQCQRWHQDQLPMRMAVNVSTKNLQDSNFANFLLDTLTRHKISARHLVLEITETDVMTDPLGALSVLTRLKEIGVGLSIDDFGTGYSSMAHLIKLPVDEIKVDRSFVKGMGEGNKESYVVVRSIIDLAKNLNVNVVAEGVEDSETLHKLQQLGCDYVQGFYLAMPMYAPQARQWYSNTAQTKTSFPVQEKRVLP